MGDAALIVDAVLFLNTLATIDYERAFLRRLPQPERFNARLSILDAAYATILSLLQ